MVDDTFRSQLLHRLEMVDSKPRIDDFAAFVHIVRTHKGISVEGLAQQIGVQPSFVAFLEMGLLESNELSTDVQVQLENALEASFDAFQRVGRQLLDAIKPGQLR